MDDRDKTKKELIQELNNLRARLHNSAIGADNISMPVQDLLETSTLFNIIVDVILILDPESGVVLKANNATIDILGFTPEQIYQGHQQGLTICKYFLPGNEGHARLMAVKAEKRIRFNTTINHKDGYPIFIEGLLTNVSLSGSDYVLAVFWDIMERKKAEKETKESQEKYRKLVDNLANEYFFYTHDANGIFTYLSPSIIDILGYTQEEFSTHYSEYLSDNPVNDEVTRKSEESIKGIKQDPYLVEILHKSGDLRWLEVTEVPIFNENGTVVAIEGIAHDITKRVQAEKALKKSEEKFRGFMESATDAFSIWDSDLNLIENNQAGMYLMPPGTRKEDVIGKSILELSPEIKKTERYYKYMEVLLTGTPFRVDDMIPDQKYGDKHLATRAFKVGNHLGMITTDITEIKTIEKSLRQSEERLRSLYKGTPVPTYTWKYIDGDFQLVDYNDAAVRMTNNNVSQFVGKKASEMYRDMPEVIEDMNRCYHEKFSIEVDMPYRFQVSGELKYLSVKYAYIPPDSILVHSEDITEKKATIEALQERERRYRLLAENVMDVIWTTDLDLNYTFITPSVLQLSGYHPEELIGTNLLANITDEFQTIAREIIKEEVTNEQNRTDHTIKSRTFQMMRKHKDGQPIWVEARVSWLRDQTGKPIGTLGVSRDITERKNAEEALSESELLYHTTIDSLEDSISLVDRDLKITLFNETFLNWCGELGLETDVVGKHIKEVFPFLADSILDEYMQVFKTGEMLFTEDENTINGRQYFTETSKIPVIEGNSVSRVITVIQNVTARKKADKDRAKLEDQLRQSQKMDAIGRLAGGIAHDFNNVLMGVRGGASLLKRHLDKDSKDFNTVLVIERASIHMAHLTDQLLTFARGREYLPEPNDLNKIVDEALELLPSTLKTQLIINRERTEGLPPVEADRIQIIQVAMNLFQNAHEAMDGKGEIFIQTSMADQDSLPESLKAGPDKYNVLHVWDTGPGISYESRKHIFDPFFTTKDYGRGLGLSAAYGIIQNHKGLITCEESPAGGAHFSVYLPVSRRAIIQDDDISIDGDRLLSKKTAMILVVDDDEISRETASSMLEMLGHRMMKAADGEEAVSLYSKHRHSIDAVLLDVMMPGIDGQEAFRRMMKINSEVRVIFTSGFHEGTTIQDDLKALAHGYLKKPYDIHKLDLVLHACLDLKSPTTDNME